MCASIGSYTNTVTLMAASVGSAFLYGITSTSMAFLNKIVIDVYKFNYPLTIMTIQMAVTFIALRTLDYFNYIKLSPTSKKSLQAFLGPCFFYSLNGVLSLAALGQMNLTMYSVVKRNGPLMTMLLASLILKKGFPGRYVILGVLMMSVGCIIAANGDITFDLEAYIFGFGSVISQSTYLILLQKLTDTFSTSDTLYMNSILSFPVLFLIAGLSGEYRNVLQYNRYSEISFLIASSSLFLMGSFLNFTLFLCNSNNSALTTSVVGTLKSVVQTTIGMFTFGGVQFNPALIAGVTINLSGGLVYTHAKYLESKKKKGLNTNQNNIDPENGKFHLNGGEKLQGETKSIYLPEPTAESKLEERLP